MIEHPNGTIHIRFLGGLFIEVTPLDDPRDSFIGEATYRMRLCRIGKQEITGFCNRYQLEDMKNACEKLMEHWE